MPNDLPEGYNLSEAHYPVRPELMSALREQETGGLADPDSAISSKGARGRYQITKPTARAYGFDYAKLGDKDYSHQAATSIVGNLIEHHKGDEREALKSYYGRGKPPPGAPTSDEYADQVLKRAGPALPEGYDLSEAHAPTTPGSLPKGYDLSEAHPPPDPGDQALRADPRIAPGEIDPFKVITEGAKLGGRVAQIATPLIAAVVAPEALMSFLPESVAGVPLAGEAVSNIGRGAGFLKYGLRILARAPGAAVRAGAATLGFETGKVATGQAPDPHEAASLMAWNMAFEGPGAVIEALRGAAGNSPEARALVDKWTSQIPVGTRGRKIADHIAAFFKDAGYALGAAKTIGQTAEEGERIATTARKPLNFYRETIQAELYKAGGAAMEARVPRSVLEEPIAEMLKDPERAAGLSSGMKSFTSKLSPTAVQQTPLGQRIAEQMKAEGIAGKISNLGRGYDTKFDPGSSFWTQPDYSVDELTHWRSKLGQVAQDGNRADDEVDKFVSNAIGRTIEQQMAAHGSSQAEINSVKDFFKAGGRWSAYKKTEKVFKLSATGDLGVDAASKLIGVARTNPAQFNKYLDWAITHAKEHPEANALPTVRDAYLLHLSEIVNHEGTPATAQAALEKELGPDGSLTFEHKVKLFGRNHPITDATKFARLYETISDPAAKEENRALGERIAQSPRLPRYIVAAGLFAGGKALLGIHQKGGLYSTLFGGSAPQTIALALGSFIAVYRGPAMARAIMSYGTAPLARAYMDWVHTPDDVAATTKFGRMLQAGIGAGEGYLAGGGTVPFVGQATNLNHPYLGAAIGAVLRGAKVPGTEAETPATAAAPGGPAAPPLTSGPRPNLSRGTGLGNRLQGFQRVGEPYTPSASAVFAPSNEGAKQAPQLPAVRNDPKPPLAWLKQKAAPIPRFELHRPAPLKDGSAKPLLPTGTVAGPEGPGQFVARPDGGQGTPVAKPATETTPGTELNTDFRKMRLDPNPTRFESNASTLGRNPERWQFKEANVEGLTDSLSGVKHYDAVQGGDLIAYYNPATEKLEVIDGHQRHYLAQNDQDSRVPYFVLDGGSNFKGALAHNVTPGAARAYAAVRNLRAGTGSSLDVAKFVRDAGLKIDDLKELNVPLSGSQMKDGLALSKLDDQVFREVAMRRFPERLGIVLGTELADEPAVQADLMKQIRADEDKGEAISPADLAEWIKMAKGAETQQMTMTDLFGERQVKQSNLKQMGQLSRFIMGDLKKDTTVFKYAGRHAERLAKGNTAVDVETGTKLSADAANRLMMYRRVAYEPQGQVRKILSEAAWEMKRNVTLARRNAIRRDAYREIQKVLPEDFDRAIEATRPDAFVSAS